MYFRIANKICYAFIIVVAFYCQISRITTNLCGSSMLGTELWNDFSNFSKDKRWFRKILSTSLIMCVQMFCWAISSWLNWQSKHRSVWKNVMIPIKSSWFRWSSCNDPRRSCWSARGCDQILKSSWVLTIRMLRAVMIVRGLFQQALMTFVRNGTRQKKIC